MKAPHVQPVELVRRVMHGVQPPHRRNAVKRPMQPVSREVRRQQHEADLCRQRDAGRPQPVDRQAGRVQQTRQPDDDREREEQRQNALHGAHEHRVRRHNAGSRPPLAPVGQQGLMQRHQRRARQHRRVRRQRHRPPKPQERRIHREASPQHRRIRHHRDNVRQAPRSRSDLLQRGCHRYAPADKIAGLGIALSTSSPPHQREPAYSLFKNGTQIERTFQVLMGYFAVVCDADKRPCTAP